MGYVLAYVRALSRSVLVLVALGPLFATALAHASVAGHMRKPLAPASQVVLRSSFEAIKGADGLVASGDYVLLSQTLNGFQNAGWVVSNQGPGTTTVLPPQCALDGVGPPWVLMSCPVTATPLASDDLELYSLTNGTQQAVTPSTGMPPQCPQPDVETECTGPSGVGAYWIRWGASCYNCAVVSYFQSIQTGVLRDDPTNATTFADLNSPTLAHETCPGVSLMAGSGLTPWGSLTYDGQFALVSDTGNAVSGNVISGDSISLERCGTRMRRMLVNDSSALNAVSWNAGAVVGQAVTTQLTGLFLPSLQTFTIPLPSEIVRPPGATENALVWLEMTSHALYVRDDWDGAIWSTASPTALPANTSRPSLARSGDALTCRRGRWRNALGFSYAWRVNGVGANDAKPTLTVDKARQPRNVICSVTASNAAGTTTVPTPHLHVH